MLREELGRAGDGELVELARRMRILRGEDEGRGREFITEVFLEEYGGRRTVEEGLEFRGIFPDERTLWNGDEVPGGRDREAKTVSLSLSMSCPIQFQSIIQFNNFSANDENPSNHRPVLNVIQLVLKRTSYRSEPCRDMRCTTNLGKERKRKRSRKPFSRSEIQLTQPTPPPFPPPSPPPP